MGLHGNDEDDLAADVEELFGSNTAINLDADVEGLPHGQAGSESMSTSAVNGSAASRKRRASTSKDWKDFEEIYEVINGKERRTGAKCRHCKKDFTGKSTYGTGHLIRHVPICPVLKGRSAMT
ncbi:hypothetical protein PAHAL_9G380000 [Panicum hallii]|jgi:beta-galactosidase/beta-glucuronidase|uniref:BED-type domain-containing protein n=1 Tax=Panicum hallii TaxID=206008 RepID=A0A2T8I3V4_9POAL|nr:hypothetical protein PAHAL_9G380000 [Panicum hallii]